MQYVLCQNVLYSDIRLTHKLRVTSWLDVPSRIPSISHIITFFFFEWKKKEKSFGALLFRHIFFFCNMKMIYKIKRDNLKLKKKQKIRCVLENESQIADTHFTLAGGAYVCACVRVCRKALPDIKSWFLIRIFSDKLLYCAEPWNSLPKAYIRNVVQLSLLMMMTTMSKISTTKMMTMLTIDYSNIFQWGLALYMRSSKWVNTFYIVFSLPENFNIFARGMRILYNYT